MAIKGNALAVSVDPLLVPDRKVIPDRRCVLISPMLTPLSNSILQSGELIPLDEASAFETRNNLWVISILLWIGKREATREKIMPSTC